MTIAAAVASSGGPKRLKRTSTTPEGVELPGVGERVPVEPAERVEDLGLRAPGRAPGSAGVAVGRVGGRDLDQGQQGLERGLRVGLGQGLVAPGGRVLELDGDPGGVADEAVGVRQVRPGGVDGLRVGVAVEGLERPTRGPGLGPGERRPVEGAVDSSPV